MALEPWVSTVAYCEINPYAQRVLIERMRDGGLDIAPIWDDVTTLRASDLPPIDIVFGGFPCQDISLAGKRAGLDGERSGLYREVIRLVGELQPTFVFLENVAAIRAHAWRVVSDLASIGFDCRWTNLSAAQVGAPHKRDRWWLLAAHPNRTKQRIPEIGFTQFTGTAIVGNDGSQESLADADRVREQQPKGVQSDERRRARDCGDETLGFYWASEPDVGRVANGIPNRVDRLRCLGNAVVPAQARQAFKYLMGLQ